MSESTEPRWYSVNNMGMATLCADKADAENVARDCDMEWPRQGPHRAVQLVEVSGRWIGCDEIVSMAREAGFSVRGETIRTMHSSGAWVGINDELEKFAELVIAKERTARIKAQKRMADMQEMAAKSGLAHRKDVQAAVDDAVAAERDACAVVCDALWNKGVPGHAKDCSNAIRARGKP